MVSKPFSAKKFIHFVLGVPPIIMIALGYYFSAVELVYELEVFFRLLKIHSPRDITWYHHSVLGRTLFCQFVSSLSHNQTSRRIYPLVYLYPATNASRQWQIAHGFPPFQKLHVLSRPLMHILLLQQKLRKERCTNGEG